MTRSDAMRLAKHDAEARRKLFLIWVEARLREIYKQNIKKSTQK